MKTTSATLGRICAVNLAFIPIALALCYVTWALSGLGGMLFSYWQSECFSQGIKAEQKAYGKGTRQIVIKVEFEEDNGRNDYFYQVVKGVPDSPIGTIEYFSVTDEGVVLKSMLPYNAKFFIGVAVFGLPVLFLFIMTGIFLCKNTPIRKRQRIGPLVCLYSLRILMIAVSVCGCLYAMERIKIDYFQPEGTAIVNSVKEDGLYFLVSLQDTSTAMEFTDRPQPLACQASPSTGQKVRIVYTHNSLPTIARPPSGKVYSILLLIITFLCLTFTSTALVRSHSDV